MKTGNEGERNAAVKEFLGICKNDAEDSHHRKDMDPRLRRQDEANVVVVTVH